MRNFHLKKRIFEKVNNHYNWRSKVSVVKKKLLKNLSKFLKKKKKKSPYRLNIFRNLAFKPSLKKKEINNKDFYINFGKFFLNISMFFKFFIQRKPRLFFIFYNWIFWRFLLLYYIKNSFIFNYQFFFLIKNFFNFFLSFIRCLELYQKGFMDNRFLTLNPFLRQDQPLNTYNYDTKKIKNLKDTIFSKQNLNLKLNVQKVFMQKKINLDNKKFFNLGKRYKKRYQLNFLKNLDYDKDFFFKNNNVIQFNLKFNFIDNIFLDFFKLRKIDSIFKFFFFLNGFYLIKILVN